MKKRIFLILLSAAALSASAFNYESLATGDGGASTNAAPLASAWQLENGQALAAAVSEDEIAAFTASEAAARDLLARVRPAYRTDPTDACRIAEVTHWVMIGADAPWYAFWCEHRQTNRRIWTEALLKTAESATDDYIRTFCLDQLRWCGYEDQCARIDRIGEKSGSNAVKDFARWVTRELKGDCIK